MTKKIVDARAPKDAKTREYEIISGSFSTYVDGERVKLKEGETIHLTPEKAAKLVNIVRPVAYRERVEEPEDAEELKKRAVDTSLRPINEIGAGLPQDAKEPAEIDPTKVDAALEAAAKTDAKGTSAPGTVVKEAAGDNKAAGKAQ